MPVVRVYFVRHGETAANREGIMQGQLDTELNEAGLDQARRTAEALENVRFVAAHTSDLQRAVKTAEAILAKHPDVPLHKHEALRERYMGDMQGASVAAWRGQSLPENMEPAAAFVQRGDRWWKEHIVKLARSLSDKGAQVQAQTEAHDPAAVLVVSHGGLLHVLLQNLIESRKVALADGVETGRYRFPNASVTVVEVGGDGRGTAVLFADTTHLDEEFVDGNADDVEAAEGRRGG